MERVGLAGSSELSLWLLQLSGVFRHPPTPACPQTRDPLGDVRLSHRGSTDTGPQYTRTGHTSRHRYHMRTHHWPATHLCACVRGTHTTSSHMCVRKCAQVQIQRYRCICRHSGKSTGTKTHKRRDHSSSADLWTQVCSHVQLLKFGSTHTHTPMSTCTQRNSWLQACVCHSHICSSLSVVTRRTVCLAQRQAFREGV